MIFLHIDSFSGGEDGRKIGQTMNGTGLAKMKMFGQGVDTGEAG